MSRHGLWASKTKLVEVVLNGDIGVFICSWKNKKDKNRVDINKLKINEISGENLTVVIYGK